MLKFLNARSFRVSWNSTTLYSANHRKYGVIATDNAFFKVSEEVREALAQRKPVVALETTIYTHGFPYPDNVALASELESIVRVNGGIPATIGILDGVARVGLSTEELERLASSAGSKSTLKLSRRDLSYACGLQRFGKLFNGGTTIAATMILAHKAGIKVFATGGLGGVHRGGQSTMDISADLTELGRTPVAVISSGCKSFLDIPRTLEYLETQGVGVITFADGREPKSVEFPAFWARDSGLKSPMVVETEAEAAALIYAQSLLSLQSGLLFANPIPENAAIPKSEMDFFIIEAINHADRAGVSGKDNTPFILEKIKELTNGRSVKANRALVASNVKRGTIIAQELSKLESEQGHSIPKDIRLSENISTVAIPARDKEYQTLEHEDHENGSWNNIRSNTSISPEIIVAGALAVDYSCDFNPLPGSNANPSPTLYTSNPAAITQSLGGVGHNVALAAHLLGRRVSLCSLVGDDLPGKTAIQHVKSEGMDASHIHIETKAAKSRTAKYVAMNDAKKDLVLGMADMGILEAVSPTIQHKWKEFIRQSKAKWFIADANLVPNTLNELLRSAKSAQLRTAFEPVSTAKAARVFNSVSSSALQVYPDHLIDLATPNALELASMHSAARSSGLLDRNNWWGVVDALGIPSSGIRPRLVQLTSAELVNQGVPQQCIQLLPFIPNIITKLGPKGVLLTMLLGKDDERLRKVEDDDFILSRSTLEDSDSMVGGIYMRQFPTTEIPYNKIVSVNGVGDTFLGALVSELVDSGKFIEETVDFAQGAAAMTLCSTEAVNPELRSLV